MTLASAPGLTAAEVRARVAAGQTNAVRTRTSRSVWDILRSNVFTWFNLILGSLWVVILLYGSWRDALFGLVLVANTAIGVAQEVRAKLTLDRLSLITAPHVRVMRDGAPAEVETGDVVLDDVVLLSPGDQMVVDGVVLEASGLEVDESTLTGEANPEPKGVGDAVLSGSFVVAGRAACRATAVGANSYAMRIESAGRRFVRVRSDIMGGINSVLKIIGVVMVPVGALTVWTNLRETQDLSASVTDTVAALVAMVPEGLVLLSSIAFAVSALTLAGRHVLVNELAAVETLARTDMVCADKTGTLTEREPTFARFEHLEGCGVEEAEAAEALGALAGFDSSPNGTMRALGAAIPEPPGWVGGASVAFSSARKWSAVDFGPRGTWVLGAPNILLDTVVTAGSAGGAPAPSAPPSAAGAVARLAELTAADLRVLLVARAPALAGQEVPAELAPVGFAVFTECVRQDAAETVRYLRDQGVELRILSGDDSATVSRIAAGVGVPGAERALDVRTLDDTALGGAIVANSVFGRVMPEQKSVMVAALQAAGHTVAMTGDGVNDVVALKQADLAIAMGSGVPAARAVAHVVLLDDRFASVPHLMAEGRRVVTNAEHVAHLFLTKSVWAGIVAVAVVVLGVPYPLLPRQITLVGVVAIGIPAFFLALSPVGKRYCPGFVGRVLRFALPAGVVISTAVVGVFVTAARAGLGLDEARTLSTIVLLAVSLAVIVLVEWPLSGWRLGVVGAMVALGALAFVIPFAREFLALTLPSWAHLGAALGVAAVAAGLIALLTAGARRTRPAG